MHLCYIDDSGDSKRGTLLTALIVQEAAWSGLMHRWIDARHEAERIWDLGKNTELHANKLFKNRGKFCLTEEGDRKFGDVERGKAAKFLLRHLAKGDDFSVLTVAHPGPNTGALYSKLIEELEVWALERDTYLMSFYDGIQGPIDAAGRPEDFSEWSQAVRNATPYRQVHRALDLHSRRVLEDVVMQDSRYSQLIQVADLLAYGAFHKHVQENPNFWHGINPVRPAIAAYLRTQKQWIHKDDFGVRWLA